MDELAERVLAHIRREELLRAGDRVGVAVSGGIDSVALLRLLIELRHELGIVLSVVHFNHKLRGAESDADQEFVAGLAREHGLEFHVASGDVAALAAEEHSGVEAAARELRYGFFQRLLGAEEGESEILQGLKPDGKELSLRGAEAPLFHGAAEAAPFPTSLAPPASQTTPIQSSPAVLLDKIATGHTLDDQAETVLMRLIRGTGMRGLGGIHPRLIVENESGGNGEIVRPLLSVRRSDLRRHLADVKQPWREDSSNADPKFTRNRLRKLVLPLLERDFNPAVVASLSELSEVARDEEDYWENEISGWLGTVVQWSQPEWMHEVQGFEGSQPLVQIRPSNSAGVNRPLDTPRTNPASAVETPCGAGGDASGQGVLRSTQDDSELQIGQPDSAVMNASVSRPWLLTEARAVQRRVLKAIGEQAGIPLEFKHIEEILRFATEDGPSGKELALPLGWKIRREAESMIFLTPDLRRQERLPDYEYPLPVPGRALVPELGVVIEALLVTAAVTPDAGVAEYNPHQLLRAEMMRGPLIVRNWRPGDRFWPAHTKAAKKIKELLQERHVAQPERRLWPVVLSGDEIVWMRGFAVPAKLQGKPGQEAVLIREEPWRDQENAI